MFIRFCALALLAASPAAWGQNAFAAVEDGTTKIVKEIRLRRPFVEVGGKLQSTATREYTLLKATVYRPGLVTLSDFRVGTHHLQDSSGGRFNYELRLHGRAKADTAFKRCFLVLELKSWKDRGWIFAEIPDLPAGASVELDFAFPLEVPLEGGNFYFHLFSDGIELLHTRMSPGYLAAQKKKTSELLAGKTDFAAIPAVSVKPEYPAELKNQKLVGAVQVRCTVNIRGEVAASELVKTSHPAFGPAALAAVAKWKFDPALKNRRMVESTVVVPLAFVPPD